MKLTVTLHIGDKQIDQLSPEQAQCFADRLSETMSLYYTAHPKERLPKKENENGKA